MGDPVLAKEDSAEDWPLKGEVNRFITTIIGGKGGGIEQRSYACKLKYLSRSPIKIFFFLLLSCSPTFSQRAAWHFRQWHF